jgi:nucleotide-binding universal stress UspA family protein
MRDGQGQTPTMVARPRSIMVGFDGSEASRRALDIAADLAGYGSTLAVVRVRRGADDDPGKLDEARDHLLRRQVSASYLEPVGEPAEALVETAAELGSDLVVVGRRTHDGLNGLGPDSVSRTVVSRAPCDVLVVR